MIGNIYKSFLALTQSKPPFAWTALPLLVVATTIASAASPAEPEITRQQFKELYAIKARAQMGDDQLADCISTGVVSLVFKQEENVLNYSTFSKRTDILQNKEKLELVFLRCKMESVPSPKRQGGNTTGAQAQTGALAVSDLLLDYTAMIGRSVHVRGTFMAIGDFSFLYEKPGSLTFVAVDTSQLSRSERKKLLTECSTGCAATFEGVVQDINYQKGIKAVSLK